MIKLTDLLNEIKVNQPKRWSLSYQDRDEEIEKDTKVFGNIENIRDKVEARLTELNNELSTTFWCFVSFGGIEVLVAIIDDEGYISWRDLS